MNEENVKVSAGLLIVCGNKILLGHPTNHEWSSSFTIPKGQLEPGETKLEAAIRETYEEVGLLINEKDIEPQQYYCDYHSRIDKVYKRIVYYKVFLNSYPSICDNEGRIKIKYLQLKEIDWAGFVSFEDAKKLIFHKQLPILESLSSIMQNDV